MSHINFCRKNQLTFFFHKLLPLFSQYAFVTPKKLKFQNFAQYSFLILKNHINKKHKKNFLVPVSSLMEQITLNILLYIGIFNIGKKHYFTKKLFSSTFFEIIPLNVQKTFHATLKTFGLNETLKSTFFYNYFRLFFQKFYLIA